MNCSDPLISAEIPDWRREHKRIFEWDPGRSLLGSIRAYQRFAHRGDVLAQFLRCVALVRHRFWSAICGADISPKCRIDGGLLIPHPNGIVIHPDAQVGPNCLIFQQVTIGVGRGGVPTVGGHVDIGAGAKVLGNIRIHDHARIGANAVVVIDVPVAATAVGVPARIMPSNTDLF